MSRARYAGDGIARGRAQRRLRRIRGPDQLESAHRFRHGAKNGTRKGGQEDAPTEQE